MCQQSCRFVQGIRSAQINKVRDSDKDKDKNMRDALIAARIFLFIDVFIITRYNLIFTPLLSLCNLSREVMTKVYPLRLSFPKE